MSTPTDRFKKRKAVLKEKVFENHFAANTLSRVGEVSGGGSSSPCLSSCHQDPFVAKKADELLEEIYGRLDNEKKSALIEACQKECLQAVIRPFGLGRILFDDMLGGNVATIHNVRSEEYFNDKKTAYIKSGESKIYDDRGDYESSRYHSHNKYKNINKKTSNDHKSVGVENSYSDNIIKSNESKHLDHVKSAKENHDDRGVWLAGLNGEDVANNEYNLKPTSGTINLSKKQKTMKEFKFFVETKKIPQLEKDISKFKNKDSLNDEEKNKLFVLVKKLEEIKSIDWDKALKIDQNARNYIDRKINFSYYAGKKFITNVATTGLAEGGKFSLQQAMGILMEEFIRATFVEVKDIWRNGFKGSVDDTFLNVLKKRLMRVVERIQTKWKDAVFALRDGFLSGFLSNLVTVIINMFKTTSARLVRMAREGFMSLYRALKLLVFPPEGMSVTQAADAASKLLAAGLVTSGGILLETSLEASLEVLGPLAPYVSSIVAGMATGLTTVFIVCLLDQVDVFGVNAETRHEQVVAKLDGMISTSYQQALEAASLFDRPAVVPRS